MMTAPRKPKSAAHWEALASQWVKHLGEFKTARTARDAMQQGNHLLLLKEASPHGTWRDRVNMLGLSSDTAQRLMAVARRFSSAPDAFFAAVGTASRLFELLPLEPKAVDVLCSGRDVHGLTPDSISTMTVMELRSAVRAALAAEGREVSPPRPAPVRLSVEEERMLRLFRQCHAPAREALFSVAGLLAKP